MIRVKRYAAEDRGDWNGFLDRARNGVFLFHRDYMEYHADRFRDHSLLFFDDDRLLALLPASERDGVLSSHGGLTFGGVLSDGKMRTPRMLDLFGHLLDYARGQGFRRLVYKAVPHIYHRVPTEEDLYALPEIARFMAIEEANLQEKYGVKPTHTAAELQLLADRFPDNIKLFAAHRGEDMLGGVVVYESRRVAHTQYIATTTAGRELGALDFILDHLLNEVFADIAYFDFGISTEDAGRILNVGLIENKESYGARAVAYDFYELDLVA
jgi:hypothetical protein